MTQRVWIPAGKCWVIVAKACSFSRQVFECPYVSSGATRRSCAAGEGRPDISSNSRCKSCAWGAKAFYMEIGDEVEDANA